MTDLARLRKLAEEIAEKADPLPEWWREAFFRVPRDQFIPDVIWLPDTDGWPRPVHRSDDPERWAAAVYRNDYVITQVDGGRAPRPDARGEELTSSSSMPGLVFAFMSYAAIKRNDRVLEIGTGTGWSAALMAAYLGDGKVTTVELDTTIASRAAASLAAAGLHPNTVIGDGSLGYAPNGPYDRVIATCAARHLPNAWVEQTRPGGVIVVPFGTLYLGHQVMVRLVTHDDGTASGPFLDHQVNFMGLRQEATTWRAMADTIGPEEGTAVSETDIDPVLVLPTRAGGGDDIAFVIGLQVPGVEFRRIRKPDHGEDTVWFFVSGPEGRATSWAAVRRTTLFG